MNTQRVIAGALAVLFLLLLWDFLEGVVFYDPLEEALVTASSALQKKAPEPAYKTGWGAEIVSRDLFNEARVGAPRAAAPPVDVSALAPVPAPTEPAINRPEVKLSGIIQGQSGERVAYLQFGTEPAIGARKGEAVRDVTVLEITERSVRLRWREDIFDLTISTKTKLLR